MFQAFPQVKVKLLWFPGHTGIPGNEKVDKLAKDAAMKKLPPTHLDTPSFTGFGSAIKMWIVKTSLIYIYTAQEVT